MSNSTLPMDARSTGRLASLPAFLKASAFWKGALDPRASLDARTPFGHMREFSSGHTWGLNIPSFRPLKPAVETELLVIEVAFGILQRGAWCPCSWRVEQALAQRMTDSGLVTVAPLPSASGLLGFSPMSLAVGGARLDGFVQFVGQCPAHVLRNEVP